MSDDYYYYRDQVKELQTVNDFVRRNTLLSVKDRIEYVKNEREKLGVPVSGIEMALEVIRTMLNEK
jgi:hypothetical protein